uniref:Ezrin-radixin-moesin-binding phosphoprotein 50 n=1 Tax=Schistosoma japonicum TaxID=6182 RepID=C1LFI8_SCHJA|nr:Ezrin-radixin-moesin-binding phosphoprotein 50 [Schistosoma japonicum]
MSSKHYARLCNLKKWEKYSGYGFSLQATKGKVGHYISEVDQQSPAFAAGLRDGDYVVEVNGINVESDQHQAVVQRILKNQFQVTLLVLDAESKDYFETNSISVNKFMVNIKKISCPAVNPFSSHQKVNGHKELISDDNDISSESGSRKFERNDGITVQSSSRTSLSSRNTNSVTSGNHNNSPAFSNKLGNNRINGASPDHNNINSTIESKIYAKQANQQSLTNNDDLGVSSDRSSAYSSSRQKQQQKQPKNLLNFKERVKIVNEL